jgi:ABC-type transporter MlaC component
MTAALASLLALLAAAPDAGPAPVERDPVATIRDAERALRTALEAGAGREALSRISVEFLDYQELARRSLGKSWSRQKPADQAALVKAVRALLEETWLPRLQPGAAYALEVRLERLSGSDAEVRAATTTGTRKLPLAFRLRRGPDRRWRVYDATVGGLAMLEGYQEQFPQLLQLGGMKKLLATLEEERAAQVASRGRKVPAAGSTR